MSNRTVTNVKITDVSEEFRMTGVLDISDLSRLVIPIRVPLSCEGYFETTRATSGTRLLVSVNDHDVIELSYDAESGRKQETVDVTAFLHPGENNFRIRCLTSCLPLEDNGDAALVWLRSNESTIIKKRYSTRGTLEPFDQRWTLWLD